MRLGAGGNFVFGSLWRLWRLWRLWLRSIAVLGLAVASCRHGTTTTTVEALSSNPLRTKFRFALSPPSSNHDGVIELEFGPLIGGPPWLPVHVQVVVFQPQIGCHKFDFVPLDATAPRTVQRLLSLQAVPGNVRYISPSDNSRQHSLSSASIPHDEEVENASCLVNQARTFVESYPDRNLHLLYNNCWTFAWRLVQHLHEVEAG